MRILKIVPLLLLFIYSCTEGNKEQTETGGKAGQKEAGKTLTAEEKLLKELERINQKQENNPDDPELFIRKARIYSELEKYQLAKKEAEIAVSIDSMNSGYHYLLGNINWQISYIGGALRHFEKAVELDPENLEARLKLGEVYFYLKDTEKSIVNLNEVLYRDELNASAYFWKGMNYKESGRAENAISNFQRSIEINPDFYEAYMQLGVLFSAKNQPQPKMARLYYDNALRINPNSVEGLYGRGMAYQQLDSINLAIKDYQRILKNQPDHRNANYNLGFLYFIRNDFNNAVKYFSAAIQKDPQYTEAYLGRGVSFKELGKVEQARQDLERVLNLDPDNEPARLELEEL